MNDLHWDDAEDIGIELYEKYPKTDPLSLRFTELHRLVIELKALTTTRLPQTKPSWKRSRWRGTRSGKIIRSRSFIIIIYHDMYSRCTQTVHNCQHPFCRSRDGEATQEQVGLSEALQPPFPKLRQLLPSQHQ